MKTVPFEKKYYKILEEEYEVTKASRNRSIFELIFLSLIFGWYLTEVSPFEFYLDLEFFTSWVALFFVIGSWYFYPPRILHFHNKVHNIELDIEHPKALRFVSTIHKKADVEREYEITYTIIPEKIESQLNGYPYIVEEDIYEEIRKNEPYYITVSANSMSFLDIHSMS